MVFFFIIRNLEVRGKLVIVIVKGNGILEIFRMSYLFLGIEYIVY